MLSCYCLLYLKFCAVVSMGLLSAVKRQCYFPHLQLHLTFSSRRTATTATPDCCFAACTGHATVTWQLCGRQKVGTEAILTLGELLLLALD